MIKIVAKCIVKENEIKTFIEAVQPLIEESRKEEGCISYTLHQDLKIPNVLTFIEEWVSEEAIELHNQSKHFKTIIPILSTLQKQASEVNLYKEI